MWLYETILLAGLALVAMVWPRRALRLERLLSPLSSALLRFPRQIPIFCGGVAALGTALVLGFGPELEPAVHDEFAYLLGAETFAEGRLTNPSPRSPDAFETFHQIMTPSYQSKYPPGQSLWLAIGIRLGSLKLALVLMAFAFTAAVTWALGALFRPSGTLIGGLLTAFKFGAGTYWTLSYWGGALTGLGGALVIGAAWRALRRPSVTPRTAFALGVGLAILALTRPYEGAVFALVPTIAFIYRALRRESAKGIPRLALCALPLLAALVFLGVYHHRVTGSVTRFPYAEYEERYTATPPFLFITEHGTPRPDASSHPDMLVRFHEGWLAEEYRVQRDGPHRAAAWWRKLRTHLNFYLGVFGIALLLAAFAAPSPQGSKVEPRDRLGWTASLLLVLASLATAYALPHYLAAGVAVLVSLFTRGLLRLGAWGPRGRALAWGIGLAVALIFLTRTAKRVNPTPSWTEARREVISKLEDQPGSDLVFVRYGPKHSMHHAWVFNPARHDAAPVLFARTRGQAIDPSVRAAYPDRRHWIVDVNGIDDPYVLRPLEKDDR